MIYSATYALAQLPARVMIGWLINYSQNKLSYEWTTPKQYHIPPPKIIVFRPLILQIANIRFLYNCSLFRYRFLQLSLFACVSCFRIYKQIWWCLKLKFAPNNIFAKNKMLKIDISVLLHGIISLYSQSHRTTISVVCSHKSIAWLHLYSQSHRTTISVPTPINPLHSYISYHCS